MVDLLPNILVALFTGIVSGLAVYFSTSSGSNNSFLTILSVLLVLFLFGLIYIFISVGKLLIPPREAILLPYLIKEMEEMIEKNPSQQQ